MNNWESLFEEFARDVYAFTYSLCRDHDLTEDIVQATFLASLKANPKKLENPKAWLFTVAYRQTGRRLKARRPVLADQTWLENMPYPGQARSEVLETRLLHEQILEFLENKKKRLAMVYKLRVESELIMDETAQVLSVPKKSVQRDLDTVRNLLRDFLSK